MKDLAPTSSAFPHGGAIPSRHTGDGPDLSPPLCWDAPPPGTVTLAIAVRDDDSPVGTWTHWLAWNVPGTARGVPEGYGAPDRADQGVNDYGHLGWGGPRPPRGHGPHRYVFTIWALDVTIALPRTATPAQLALAMQGHVLASGQLVGTYQRS